MLLFGKEWFERYKHFMRIAINIPIPSLRENVREKIGIVDFDSNYLVTNITPSSYTIQLDEFDYTSVICTRPNYSVNLHKEFELIWASCHKFDILFANRYAPKLNLGFDSFTSFPDSHPEVNTFDGYVGFNNASWSSCRNAIIGNVASDNGNVLLVGAYSNYPENTMRYIKRGIFLFDTSSILENYNVFEVSIRLYSHFLDAVACECSQTQSNTAINLSDYNKPTGVAWASISRGPSYGWAQSSLNQNCINSIKSNSITRIGLRNSFDYNNIDPNYISATDNQIHSSERGNTYSPRLIVTYSKTKKVFMIV